MIQYVHILWPPESEGCYEVVYPTKTHRKHKSREISFAHNLFFIYQIVLKFYTEHGGITAVLCAQFHNDLAIKMDVMDERDFARKCEFRSDILYCYSLYA